jgi:hypothetical protein
LTSRSLPAGSPAAQLSGAIGVARVLCILGIVYVHAWTGLPGWALANSDHTMQGALRWTLMEFLGRSAVPLLGMISGWLVAGSAASRPYPQFVAGKVRTILLPMAAWNAIAIVLVSSAAYAGLLAAPRPPLSPAAFQWFANELFSLTRVNHINVQMPFLRDLFVCMLMAPFLLRMSNWWLVAVALTAAVWAISGEFLYLLLRPAILLFFVSGILVRRAGLETRAVSLPMLAALAPFIALALLRVVLAIGTDFNGDHPHLRVALDLVLRFAAALAFWRLSWALAGSRAAPMLLRVEPFMFLMFCCHLILIWFGGPAIGSVVGKLGSPLYPLFLIAHPFLALGASMLIGLALVRVAPGAARFLSGGRLKRPRPAGPAPASEIRGQGAL